MDLNYGRHDLDDYDVANDDGDGDDDDGYLEFIASLRGAAGLGIGEERTAPYFAQGSSGVVGVCNVIMLKIYVSILPRFCFPDLVCASSSEPHQAGGPLAAGVETCVLSIKEAMPATPRPRTAQDTKGPQPSRRRRTCQARSGRSMPGRTRELQQEQGTGKRNVARAGAATGAEAANRNHAWDSASREITAASDAATTQDEGPMKRAYLERLREALRRVQLEAGTDAAEGWVPLATLRRMSGFRGLNDGLAGEVVRASVDPRLELRECPGGGGLEMREAPEAAEERASAVALYSLRLAMAVVGRSGNGHGVVGMEADADYDLFDVDANLTHKDLAAGVAEHLAVARQAGVRRMLVPASSLEESHATIALCRAHPSVLFATVGVHPFNARAAPESEIASAVLELEQLARANPHPLVVAVGETGLDGSEGFPPLDAQVRWFQPQVDLACRLGLPLFLHERAAHELFLKVLDVERERWGTRFPPAIVHCFDGSAAEVDAYLQRGFFVSVSGHLCRSMHKAKSAKKKDSSGDVPQLHDVIKRVPLERLMVETDAPFLGFAGCRKLYKSGSKRQTPNVPAALPQVVEALAAALGKSPSEVGRATNETAMRFFRLVL